MNKIGLFLGRFQPFHLGHLEHIEHALNHCDKLYVMIATSKNSDHSNPFTYEERLEMLNNSLNDKNNVEILQVRDNESDSIWIDMIKKEIDNTINIVFTNNPVTRNVFENYTKIETFGMTGGLYDDISGTVIRREIIRNGKWKKMIPDGTLKVIKKIRSQ